MPNNRFSGSSTASSSTSPHPVVRQGQSTLHELLMRKGENPPTSPVYHPMDVTATETARGKLKVSRLSMSAPTQSIGAELLWSHREPRKHLTSTGSLGPVEAGSTSSLSTGDALSPDPLGHLDPFSHDEGYEDSDDDSDHYDDFSTDNGNSFFSLLASQQRSNYTENKISLEFTKQFIKVTVFLCDYRKNFRQKAE